MDLSASHHYNPQAPSPGNSSQTGNVSYMSPSACSPSYARPALLSSNLPPSVWEASADLDFYGLEVNAYEPSWLLDGDFDLDALNHSIFAAGSPWQKRPAPTNTGRDRPYETTDGNCDPEAQAIARESTRKAVEMRWYTRPARDASYPHARTKLQDQDQVDEAYRAGLSSRLAPSPPDNTLPSADFLVRYSPCPLCISIEVLI